MMQKYKKKHNAQYFFNSPLIESVIFISMKHIIFISILLLAVGAQAQRRGSDQVIQAYPALGLTTAQIEGDELKGFNKWGFTAGVGAKINLGRSELLKLSVEAAFAQRGSFNNSELPYRLGLCLNYVDIPVMLHFTDPYGGMTIGAGLDYGRLVQQPHGLMEFPDSFVPDTANMTFLRNDLSFVIGLQFTVWRGLKFDVRYQQSILPVKKDMQFDTIALNHEHCVYTNDLYNQSVSVRLIYVLGDDGHKPKPGYYKHHRRKSHNHRRR